MLAEDVVNRALDMAGCEDQQIGSMTSGTRGAQLALRHYIPCLEQLLRSAYWNFCRRQTKMQLLGARPSFVGQQAREDGVGFLVIEPWTFEYAWPIDCLAARFVPLNHATPQGSAPADNISVPPVPPTTFETPFRSGPHLEPARMLVANDTNYPLPTPPDGPAPEWWNVRGQAIEMRTVVLCNVPEAQLVYTAFVPYPNLWDPLFTEAMCALLATHFWHLGADKKEARAVRADNIKIAAQAISTARVRDGNEGFPSVEHIPDWIRGRNIGTSSYGGWGGGGSEGPGVLGYGWSGIGGIIGGDAAAY